MKSKKASTGVGASAAGAGAGAAASNFLSNSGGMFHTGVLNSCPANDMSFFCQMSRWFSILMIIIAVLVIIYLAYVFIGPYFMKKRR
jgi:hypothetical protein